MHAKKLEFRNLPNAIQRYWFLEDPNFSWDE